MALPFAFLALVELGLRLGHYGGDGRLFVEPDYRPAGFKVVNPDLSRRYFAGDPNPPGLSPEPFLAAKPEHGFRVFVLGESTAAGFPFLRNGAFSRVLADALRDVMPSDTVEVVNLAVAAVSSYVVADIAREALAEHPDVLVVYSGHNEYYGVYGVASTRASRLSPALMRFALRVGRLRLAQLLMSIVRRPAPAQKSGVVEVSRMEQLATSAPIAPGGEVDRRGVEQLRSNLEAIASWARRSGTLVLAGSQASNLRDLPPFASAGEGSERADSAFARARAELAAGRTANARAAFTAARDLDAVKFRATSQLNGAIASSSRPNVVYVPTAEAIAGLRADSIPGNDQFYEHVHPRRGAVVALARAYFDALAAQPAIRSRMQLERLRPWDEYARRMELTPMDEQLAQLTVDVIVRRWPFTPPGTPSSFVANYHPVTPVDSAAFAAMIGVASWSGAKMQLAKRYIAHGFADSALAEYRGLEREYPWDPLPARLSGLLLESAGRDREAAELLERARSLGGNTPEVEAALGRIAQRAVAR